KSSGVSSHQFGIIHVKRTIALKPCVRAEISFATKLDRLSNFPVENTIGGAPFRRDHLQVHYPFHATRYSEIDLLRACAGAGVQNQANEQDVDTSWRHRLFGQNPPHLAKDFILAIDEAVVIRVREHDDTCARKLFTKAVRLFLFNLIETA